MTQNQPRRFRFSNRRIQWLLALAVGAFLLFAGLLYKEQHNQSVARSWVDHTNQTIKKIDAVNILLSETESASRGFLLTKDTNWVVNLHMIHQRLNESITDLALITSTNNSQQKKVQILENLVRRKESFQNTIVRDFMRNGRELEKIRSAGDETQVTASVKKMLGDILAIEEVMLSDRIKNNEDSYKDGIYIMIAAGVFSFGLVLIILFQLNADVLLRKKAERNLIRSESKYRNLIENAGVVMYTADITGHINFANNQVAALTGYTVSELAGKHFSILLDPADAERVVGFYINQFAAKKNDTTLEFATRTKSGELKWVEQSAQLLMKDDGRITGFQCMVKDISAKKKVEQQLGKSESERKQNEYRLNAILDNSTALIYIKDLEGVYVTANRKFKEFFGLNDELVIGCTDYDFNPKDVADHYKQMDDAVLTSLQPLESEELIETPWGNRNLLLLKFPLLTADGVLIGVSGIATDVTDKVETHKQLISALQKTETAQQIQEQFLANMSHEIRTPMNGIQGMTRLLLDTKLTEEQKGFTNIISQSLNNLAVIVNNVLDFSNLKTGRLTFDKQEFNLAETVEEIKKQFEKEVTKKQLVFQISVDAAVPRVVKGDAFRLKQVLANLVSNAVKFTEKGQIVLQLSVQQQTDVQAVILFRLSDTGIGIAKEKQETIFEGFAQAGKNISTGYGGAGLGLTISKGLIELQDGSISVKSSPGEGSVFIFHIPFGMVKEKDAPVAPADDYAEKLKGKRILVVEDNPVNQKLISFVLKKMGVVITLAGNGKEAIDVCKTNPPYDIIIMDLQMPVMDGYEATIYLRNEMKLETPIIAMTATVLKEDQERSSRVGMNDFMVKPFDFNDLYTRLIRILFHEEEKKQTKTEIMSEEKLYDLSLLEDLGDTDAIVEVLTIFFANTPTEIRRLEFLYQEKNYSDLHKLAHKLKSAVSIFQAVRLTELLKNIEANIKQLIDIPETEALIKEAVSLFDRMELQLREEMVRLKSEL
jgi:PAS domain S-box-containing protein